eukprot:SAG11_NODE_34_length_22265_cov_11.264730_4_plen_219_part_00
MRYVFEMQNASGSLSAECQASNGADAWKCILAPYAGKWTNGNVDMEILVSDKILAGARCVNNSRCERREALHIKTPWFAMQSRFDQWQLGNELFLKCVAGQPYAPPYPAAPNNLENTCTPAAKAALEQYGPDFMAQFTKVMQASNRNGGFVDACIIHGSTESTIDGHKNGDAFNQWMEATERKVGSATQSWFLMKCPDGKGGMSTSTGPCDTAPVCVP